ncbi:hypothetical protein HAX54_023672 [Datura stramonium]|uniref:Uncharacterized protein n=1 Tax=Datura stramonium TaxID=4076 RepID=A0ABS8UZ67_DATST|nr:hypothetical protein [Datura stramonium]
MSIDPTKLLDPPMPSYTFTIYNLDLFEKSKFKDYDSLFESGLSGCQARADYLASILENGRRHESKRAREKLKNNKLSIWSRMVTSVSTTWKYMDGTEREEPKFPVVKLYFGREKPENLLLLTTTGRGALCWDTNDQLGSCLDVAKIKPVISSASSSRIVGLGRDIFDGYSLPSQFGGNLMSMCLPKFSLQEKDLH